MNIPIPVQNILDSIENLSQEEQILLFKQLKQQVGENREELTQTTVSENPWIKLAGKYQNDPQYDEVLAYIEQYRCELDAKNEPLDGQLPEEEVKKASWVTINLLWETLDDLKLLNILKFDQKAYTYYTELRSQKIRIGRQDLKIASIALATNSILITRNSRDFNKIPHLRFEDWAIPA